MNVGWVPLPFFPPRESTIQASGICFTRDHRIVLVNDGKNWQLPGGTPEKDETLEAALLREIAEEACAEVVDFEYVGCIRNERLRPGHQGKAKALFKARYWVRVRLSEFHPKHETISRIEIAPDRFSSLLSWNARLTAGEILRAALLVENAR